MPTTSPRTQRVTAELGFDRTASSLRPTNSLDQALSFPQLAYVDQNPLAPTAPA
jgi:hypothetical protein